MINEIKIPDIGTDMVEVTEILVSVGDQVICEQPLLTVEGDKASIEIPSPKSGIVESIIVVVGDKVITGQVFMKLSENNNSNVIEGHPESIVSDNKQDFFAKVDAHDSVPLSSQVVLLPDVGEDEVEVTDILVKVGDSVSIDQSLLIVEGDKASMEIPSPLKGIVKKIMVYIGSKVRSDSPILDLAIVSDTNFHRVQRSFEKDALDHSVDDTLIVKDLSKSAGVSHPVIENCEENNVCIHATPLIRRLAREFGVNLSKITGTGRKGRILREDIQRYVKETLNLVEQSCRPSYMNLQNFSGLPPWPKVDFSKFGEVEKVEIGRIQKISGANLSRNWVVIPHVTQFDESDISDLEEFRRQKNNEMAKKGLDFKITITSFLLKVLAKALQKFPIFNSSFLMDEQKIIVKKYINIGVAVDTPKGLIVAVIKDVEKKGIVELAQNLTDMSNKARLGKLTKDDMQGSCFTISSLGGLGGTSFTPIVNAPEVAILGVSKAAIKPIWDGKAFCPRLMLPLSLSYDHRVVDGVAGVKFIRYISELMADIRCLLL